MTSGRQLHLHPDLVVGCLTGMKLAVSLEDFEGLIFRTTVMLMPYVEEDFDEVQQLLRIKVWKAYEKYDPARSKLPIKAYVFGCLMNYKKDLVKRRHRNLAYIEDFRTEAGTERFEGRNLSVDADTVYLNVEDEKPILPNTLTGIERRVIGFLLMDYTATEISRTLGIGPKRLRGIRDKIEEKMADWRPSVAEPILEAA